MYKLNVHEINGANIFCFVFFISVIFHNAKTRCNNGYYSKVYEHFIVLHKYRSILLLGFLTNAPTENNGKNDYLFIINPLCIFVKWHAIINGGLQCDVFLTQRSSSLRKHESKNNIIWSGCPCDAVYLQYILLLYSINISYLYFNVYF